MVVTMMISTTMTGNDGIDNEIMITKAAAETMSAIYYSQ